MKLSRRGGLPIRSRTRGIRIIKICICIDARIKLLKVQIIRGRIRRQIHYNIGYFGGRGRTQCSRIYLPSELWDEIMCIVSIVYMIWIQRDFKKWRCRIQVQGGVTPSLIIIWLNFPPSVHPCHWMRVFVFIRWLCEKWRKKWIRRVYWMSKYHIGNKCT